MTLSSPENADIAVASAVGRIADDDIRLPTLSVVSGAGRERRGGVQRDARGLEQPLRDGFLRDVGRNGGCGRGTIEDIDELPTLSVTGGEGVEGGTAER